MVWERLFNYAALSLHPNLERISELCCTTLVLFISAQWRLRNRGTYLTKHPPQHTNGNTLPPVADGLHCSDSNTAATQPFLFFVFVCLFLCCSDKITFFPTPFFVISTLEIQNIKCWRSATIQNDKKLDLHNIYFKCNYKSLHRYLKVSVSGFTIRMRCHIFFQTNEK